MQERVIRMGRNNALLTTETSNRLHWLHADESSVVRKIKLCSMNMDSTITKVRLRFEDQTVSACELLAFVTMDSRKRSPEDIIQSLHKDAGETQCLDRPHLPTYQVLQNAIRTNDSVHVHWKEEEFTVGEIWASREGKAVLMFLWKRLLHIVRRILGKFME
jgi:hypothetical protein